MGKEKTAALPRQDMEELWANPEVAEMLKEQERSRYLAIAFLNSMQGKKMTTETIRTAVQAGLALGCSSVFEVQSLPNLFCVDAEHGCVLLGSYVASLLEESRSEAQETAPKRELVH